MFKLHTNAKHLAKRLALLSCATAICALGVGGTAMAAPPTVTTPYQEVDLRNPGGTHAAIQWMASDDVGIAEQTVWHGTEVADGYSWSPIRVPSTVRIVRVSVADSASHTFVVAARDVEGNWSSSGQSRPFKRRVLESSASIRPLMSVGDFWQVFWPGPAYSGGGTLVSGTSRTPPYHWDLPFYVNAAWSSRALNVALIGTVHYQFGQTNVRYRWAGGTASSGPHLVNQRATCSGCFYPQQVLHQKRFSTPTAGDITVTNVTTSGGFSDVDAIVLFEYSPLS